MKNSYLILLCFTLWGCTALKKTNLNTVNTIKTDFIFPMEWIGHYRGQLKIFGNKGDTSSISMQLIIGNPDGMGLFPWTIQYGEDDIRNYSLEILDPVRQHYKIDEYNSIQLDAYLKGGHFISRFEVLGSDLTIDYERVEGGVNVLLYGSSSRPVSVTGSEIIGLDTIPEVKSFPIVVFQKAFLELI